MPAIRATCVDFRFDRTPFGRSEDERERCSRWFCRRPWAWKRRCWQCRRTCSCTTTPNTDDERVESIPSTEVRPSQTPTWVSFAGVFLFVTMVLISRSSVPCVAHEDPHRTVSRSFRVAHSDTGHQTHPTERRLGRRRTGRADPGRELLRWSASDVQHLGRLQ